jgi:hypothetical protein
MTDCQRHKGENYQQPLRGGIVARSSPRPRVTDRAGGADKGMDDHAYPTATLMEHLYQSTTLLAVVVSEFLRVHDAGSKVRSRVSLPLPIETPLFHRTGPCNSKLRIVMNPGPYGNDC